MSSPWSERWGLRGRVSRRVAIGALLVLFVARCAGDGDACCCCDGYAAFVDTMQPESEAVEAVALAWAQDNAALGAETGGATDARITGGDLGLLRVGTSVEGEALRIPVVRVEGPRGSVTAHVYVARRGGEWIALGARFERDGEWITEGSVPRQEVDEIAEAAIAWASRSPMVIERVGAIESATVALASHGEPWIRPRFGYEGGTVHEVDVTVVGATGTLTFVAALQESDGRFDVRYTEGGLVFGTIPARERSGGGGSSSGFDWD